MDLQQLRLMGAIKDRSIVPRTITTMKHRPLLPESEWVESGVPQYAEEAIEDTIDCFIRKQSAADAIEIAGTERRLQPFVYVLRCVVDQNGAQVFPDLDTVIFLEEWILGPLFKAVKEVNHADPKPSPPRTNSGASSRSVSGGAPSPSGKKFSRRKSFKRGPITGASADR